jgi:hypothetical protein
MKAGILIFVLCFFGQFCFGQTLTGKTLHGMVVNDSIKIKSGYVLNMNSNSRASINSQGFFDIVAKTNDTLFFSSFGLKTKKIVLTHRNFNTSMLVVKLNVYMNQLKEVVVSKTFIKPNLGDTQTIVDTQYMDDKQSSVDNPLLPVEMKYAMDVGRVSKMIWRVFVKAPDKTEVVDYGSFAEVVKDRINPRFLTNTLQIKEDQVGLFLIFCENDSTSQTLLKPESEFELIEFLTVKSDEFKRMVAFENGKK